MAYQVIGVVQMLAVLFCLASAQQLGADELAAPPKIKPLKGAAVIVGQIDARPECAKDEFVAWLSQDSLLLYQVDAVARGNFEMHVLPGRYNLVVTSSSGCFSETHIEVDANRVQVVTVSPVPTARPDKHASLLDWLLPSARADYYGNCPTCNMMAYYQMQPSFMPQQPWPAYYGSMAYPNFGYPGPWTGYAMNGSYYPGGNMSWGMNPGMNMGPGPVPGMSTGMGVGFGKPLLYLEGKDGTQVSVKVKMVGDGNWLVAVPAHGESAWTGKLQGGHILIGGAEYRDLFYDYRADSVALQDTRGFCTTREGLMPKFKAALRDSGFKEGEIHDFEQYWSVKIPLSKRYCVFPQSTSELQKLAQVEIEPKPASWTQLTFIVQVDEALTGKPGRFTRAPTQTWEAQARVPASTESAVADGALKAREWGVGFFMTSGKSQ